jgi:hypothetical protein
MKKYSLIIVMSTFYSLFAQNTDEYTAIKLYIDKYQITEDNSKNLTENEINRLYQRTSQLVNQAGITEIGYSNFLVSPILDVISINVDNAGTTKTFLAECELFITIKRTNINKGATLGSASFATFSKKIMGSGFTKEEARSNALSNIRTSDEDYRDFFLDTKKKIDEYYILHCNDVIKEAAQALALKQYSRSISLYYSVPSSAPKECYKKAFDSIQKVYDIYILDECEKQVAKMKTFAALAETDESKASKYYENIIKIIEDISPSAKRCFATAKQVMEKIEKKLDEKQKQEWELRKINASDEKEMEKERIKAMKNINQNYVPPYNININGK